MSKYFRYEHIIEFIFLIVGLVLFFVGNHIDVFVIEEPESFTYIFHFFAKLYLFGACALFCCTVVTEWRNRNI